MSGVADIVWRGFGSWSTVVKVPTRGYGIGVMIAQEPICFTAVLCSGVAYGSQFDNGASASGRLDSGYADVAELEGEKDR